MSSFSLTQNGLTYTNENNETKSIVIDDANNTIKFEKFNISTPSVTNVEYVPPTTVETANFNVGPIYNSGEARAKAEQWIIDNKPGEGWYFTGAWWSISGTSYGHFTRTV